MNNGELIDVIKSCVGTTLMKSQEVPSLCPWLRQPALSYQLWWDCNQQRKKNRSSAWIRICNEFSSLLDSLRSTLNPFPTLVLTPSVSRFRQPQLGRLLHTDRNIYWMKWRHVPCKCYSLRFYFFSLGMWDITGDVFDWGSFHGFRCILFCRQASSAQCARSWNSGKHASAGGWYM